jgi:hypothetical protein
LCSKAFGLRYERMFGTMSACSRPCRLQHPNGWRLRWGEWFATRSAHAGHEEVGDRLLATRMIINELELGFARDAAAFAALTDPDLDENPLAWIREECRMTVNAAVNAIRIGEQEARLEGSVEAFLAGRIGFPHLGLLSRVAEFATARQCPVAFDESALLAKAGQLNVARFAKECYHAEHAMDAAECVASAVLDVDSGACASILARVAVSACRARSTRRAACSCAPPSSPLRRRTDQTTTAAVRNALPTRSSSWPLMASTPAPSRSGRASAPTCR